MIKSWWWRAANIETMSDWVARFRFIQLTAYNILTTDIISSSHIISILGIMYSDRYIFTIPVLMSEIQIFI